jgi:2-oxoglutarate/2-oxoacid ferredoxin oxidoreductase subunit alpha
MVNIREDKVMRVADYIPLLEIEGDQNADLLVVGWGGTQGMLQSAVGVMQREGHSISLAHFNYIMPLPKNTSEVLSRFKKIIVCELNKGQFVNYLRMVLPEYKYLQYNKVQGLPFHVKELTQVFTKHMEEK